MVGRPVACRDVHPVTGTCESCAQLTLVPPSTYFLHRHIFWSFFTLLLANIVIFFPHLKKKLFIWLHGVLVAAHGIFGCDMQTFRCSTWGLVPWVNSRPLHRGHGVLTLDHQGSPLPSLLIISLRRYSSILFWSLLLVLKNLLSF